MVNQIWRFSIVIFVSVPDEIVNDIVEVLHLHVQVLGRLEGAEHELVPVVAFYFYNNNRRLSRVRSFTLQKTINSIL